MPTRKQPVRQHGGGPPRIEGPRTYQTSLTDTYLQVQMSLRTPVHRPRQVSTRILYRYLMLCEASLPTFTEREWCAIFSVLEGIWMHPRWNPKHLYVEILDTPHLDTRWHIDQEALGLTLHRLPLAACLAIVDAAERFWTLDPMTRASISFDRDIPLIVGRTHIAPDPQA